MIGAYRSPPPRRTTCPECGNSRLGDLTEYEGKPMCSFCRIAREDAPAPAPKTPHQGGLFD